MDLLLIKFRLEKLHDVMFDLLDKKLYLAPVENPQRILDIGTGTGIWAIDVAETHPHADVIGVDLR
jgi:methylase of polypeptide subunit release factors